MTVFSELPPRSGPCPWRILAAVPEGPQEVVLQYATGRGLGSWAIRYRAGSDWSHVDVVHPDGTLTGARSGRERGADGRAWEAGVRRRAPDYAEFVHAMRVRVRTRHAACFYDWVACQVGKPYDERAIRGFILNRQMERDWRDSGAWFCDEMVVAGLEIHGHWPQPLALPYDRIDPGGSLLALSAGPSYEEIEGQRF